MLKKKHAIIIGAGPAGLTAAYYLLTMTNIKPIILEREKFVGGLAAALNFGGNRLDIGGHRFFSENKNVLALWQKFLPAQNPEDGDDVFLERDFTSAVFYRKKIFPCPIALNFNTVKKVGLLKSFSFGASFLKTKFGRRAENTLEDLMTNRFGQKLYETFLRDQTTKIFGRTPAQINLATFGKVLPDFAENFFAAKDEPPRLEKFFYPKFGSGQMWENVAAEIKKLGGEILFSANAEKFRADKNKIIKSVAVDSAAGKLTFPADYFLSTMPLADLAAALDEEILPARPRRIAEGLPYRNFIIVGLLVNKQTLGEIAPYNQIYIQEPSVKISRVEIFNNWSPFTVADSNSAWLGLEYFCNENDALWQMSEQDFIKFAIEEIAALGIIDAAGVRDSVQIKVPKAYPAQFETYENISELYAALDEIKNLYSIGRNGHHRRNNMAQSMLTALAAVCAIADKFSKPDIWKINAEKIHQEGRSNE